MSSKNFYGAAGAYVEHGMDFDSVSNRVADMVLLMRIDPPLGCFTENPDADADSGYNPDYTTLFQVFSI